MHFELWCALKATGIFLGGLGGCALIVWGLCALTDWASTGGGYHLTKGVASSIGKGFGKLLMAAALIILGGIVLYGFGGMWMKIYKAICPMMHHG